MVPAFVRYDDDDDDDTDDDSDEIDESVDDPPDRPDFDCGGRAAVGAADAPPGSPVPELEAEAEAEAVASSVVDTVVAIVRGRNESRYETGYGYILKNESGGSLDGIASCSAFPSTAGGPRFREPRARRPWHRAGQWVFFALC